MQGGEVSMLDRGGWLSEEIALLSTRMEATGAKTWDVHEILVDRILPIT
jgi:hypothetical protein